MHTFASYVPVISPMNSLMQFPAQTMHDFVNINKTNDTAMCTQL